MVTATNIVVENELDVIFYCIDFFVTRKITVDWFVKLAAYDIFSYLTKASVFRYCRGR